MQCPICGFESNVEIKPSEISDYTDVDCPLCGNYSIDKDDYNLYESDPDFADSLSHWMCKNEKEGERLLFDYKLKRNLEDKIKLPDIKEQADLLIRRIGDNLGRPHEEYRPYSLKLANCIGAVNLEGLDYLLQHLSDRGLLINRLTTRSSQDATEIGNGHIKLTFDGWQYYHQLKEEGGEYNKAFMAMQFGNDNIDEAYEEFKKAVGVTGFNLFNLQEVPKAGLIDNRIRTEIRNSAFLLADLTNDNNGAYWEAGYAEGLGKPVIYLCEKDHFDEFKTHFDTNHHFTVIYDLEDLNEACEQLKATIRTTLPDKAIMKD